MIVIEIKWKNDLHIVTIMIYEILASLLFPNSNGLTCPRGWAAR